MRADIADVYPAGDLPAMFVEPRQVADAVSREFSAPSYEIE